MASRKTFHAKPTHLYQTLDTTNTHAFEIEFDEADIWGTSNHVVQSETKKSSIPTSRSSKKVSRGGHTAAAASSLPVNIPDWSQILKERGKRESEEAADIDGDDEYDDDGDYWIPPHEYLARRRGASFSVHEGIGRTLKGRDLSQVRNAIWKKTGFED